MGNAEEVRHLIRARILSGQLPAANRYEIFGRKGDGLPCACCDDVITPQAIEYVVEFADLGLLVLPMHAHCYLVWQEVSYSVGGGEPSLQANG